MKMHIIKKFIPNKEIYLIKKLKKKNVIKFYTKKQNKIILNEISGYKYFNKINIFKVPKLISFNKKARYLEIEYIPGYRTSFFDIKKIFLREGLSKKKTTIKNYLDLKCKNKKEENFLFIKDFFNTKNILKKKIYISKSHGDFARYNIIKYDGNFYVIDFEKFGERIFSFDIINWYSHTIFYKISKYIIFKNLKFSKNIFFSIILNIIYFYIQNRVTYFYKRKKILSNQKFKIYFILYLFEKIKMISEDIKFITSTKEKKEIKKFILLLNEILRRSVEK
tara:strand:+ start:761 stop:1597 length:837 start_codon:yes stop_codon:yes gene_type:complete